MKVIYGGDAGGCSRLDNLYLLPFGAKVGRKKNFPFVK